MTGRFFARWVVALLLMAVSVARGATAGAWETFFDEQNTQGWFVRDYGAPNWRYPAWQGTPAGLEYAYTTYTSDKAVGFVADELTAGGAFSGDYLAQKIAAISCYVYIGSLADLDYIDCSVYANGPAGKNFYFAAPYYAEEFAGAGWYWVSFGFNESWSYWNGSAWVTVAGASLNGIEQLEIAFTPKAGITGGSAVGVDDVTLEPTVAAPTVQTGVTAGTPKNFTLSFTPEVGTVCRIEKMRLSPASGWDTVAGENAIKLPVQHVFTTPTTASPGIFRVAAEASYVMVFTD